MSSSMRHDETGSISHKIKFSFSTPLIGFRLENDVDRKGCFEDLAKEILSGELPIKMYAIMKGLHKHPNDFPDAKLQPHIMLTR